MAGILNNKERMIDFIVTEHGKQMIVDGRLKPMYASLTDQHTFYQASSSLEPNIAEDATDRLFFEATQKHQDTIVPTILPGRTMNPFDNDDLVVIGSIMAEGTFVTGSSLVHGDALKGRALIDASQKYLKALATHFVDHRFLSTKDEFSDTTDFKITAHTASFVIADNPDGISGNNIEYLYADHHHLDDLPHIAEDWRFSHLPNFKYLPPVNVSTEKSVQPLGSVEDVPIPLGNYPNLQSLPGNKGLDLWDVHGNAVSYSDLNQMILSRCQQVTFEFSDTSAENNLIGQLYELNNPDTGGFEKLSIIDLGVFLDTVTIPGGFGEIPAEAAFIDSNSPYRHVFAAGRIEEDSKGSSVFVGLFYLVFD